MQQEQREKIDEQSRCRRCQQGMKNDELWYSVTFHCLYCQW